MDNSVFVYFLFVSTAVAFAKVAVFTEGSEKIRSFDIQIRYPYFSQILFEILLLNFFILYSVVDLKLMIIL